MAQLVIAVGAAALLGPIGLGLVSAGTGFLIGSTAASLLGIGAPHQEGPKLGDLRVTGTEYGQPVPWVAGSPRIAGQVAWASDRRETKSNAGGKGGPSSTTYSYDCDILIMLTENQISGIARVWSNNELVYDGKLTKSGVWSNLTVYTGDPAQLPDPIYEAAVGTGNAPAYRGRGYVMIQGLQLGSSGVIPNLTFEPGTTSPTYDAKKIFPWGFSTYDIGTNSCVLSTTPTHGDCINGLMECNIAGVSGFFPDTSSAIAAFSAQVLAGANPYAVGTVYRGFYTDTNPLPSYFPGGATFDDNPQYVYAIFSPSGPVVYADGPTVIPGGSGCFYLQGMGATIDNGIKYCSPLSPYNFYTLESYGTPTTGSTNPYPYGQNCTNYPPNGSGYYPLGVYAPGTVVRMRRLLSCDKGCTEATFALGQVRCLIYQEIYTNSVLTTNASGPVLFAGDPNFNNETWWRGQAANLKISLVGRSFQNLLLSEGAPANAGLHFAVYPPSVCQCSGTFHQTTSTVHDSVTSLLLRAGYASTQYDTSALSAITQPVRGLAVGQISNSRSPIEALQSVFFFVASKSDKVYLRPRAVNSIATIPIEDLGASVNASGNAEPLALIIGNELELPAQISLSYPNMGADWQVGTESSDRLLTGQTSNQPIQTPIGLLPFEAKAVADGTLIDQISALTHTMLSLPLKYARLEPGDVITATNLDGRQYRLRITSKKDTLAVLEFECTLDDVGALVSAAVTDSGYITTTNLSQIASTILGILDIPTLHDADNSPGFYAAVAPKLINPNDTWASASVFESSDNITYTNLLTTSKAAIFGQASNTLGAFSDGNVFDEINQLTVTVNGQLSSSTRSAMLLDGTVNLLLVGSEIVQFRNAALVSSGVYSLTGFLRGRFGTEAAINNHPAGGRVVLLNATVNRVLVQSSDLFVNTYVKAATGGQLLSVAAAQSFTNTGASLKPLSPVHARALKSGSDLALTWQRRTRLSYRYGGLSPVVPLGEATESYQVQIFNGSALKRTATVSVQAYIYAAADIATDGFMTGNTITFKISQLSTSVGKGSVSTITGTAP